MKKGLLSIALLLLYVALLNAQTITEAHYTKAFQAPPMRFVSQDVDKYQKLLASLQNDDEKIYANNVKEKFGLYALDSSEPEEKYIASDAFITIENPLYDTNHLMEYLSHWVKSNGFGEVMGVDTVKNIISSCKSVQVATHSTFFDTFKVSVVTSLVIQLEKDKLFVLLRTGNYKNERYPSSGGHVISTNNPKVSAVFPFNPKSANKSTYAKAYVGTYKYFWDLIKNLRDDLNSNFTKDTKMLTQMHYDYSVDSLTTKYGELTKAIVDNPKILDVHKELRFYEQSQKLVFMHKTVDFKDIISCEITDDPTFVPGKTTIVGGGVSIFGFGIGGAEAYKSADKKIHNYVVNIKIDNLKTPYIRIATSNNEAKAKEIESSFEYILRHQQDKKKIVNRNK